MNMKMNMKNLIPKDMRPITTLWATQLLSTLGSSMTSFALIVWAYQQEGSALSSALLAVCSYAPYVLMSIFAGALCDRWDRTKTLLICDALAACGTLAVAILLHTGGLQLWHLYLINALSGLMNTIQQPAADVTVTLLTPKSRLQRVASMRAFSTALTNILAPALASAMLLGLGMTAVLAFDLATFAAAFVSLAWLIPIPRTEKQDKGESLLDSAGVGLRYLKQHRGVLYLMLLLAGINLVASMFNATLPAMMLSRNGGSEAALATIQTVTGVAMLIGSLIASALPQPKSRVRMIMNALLLSMSTENFCLALGRSLPVWCLGAVLGWIAIPLMNTNMEALLRGYIPVELQGRVWATRNTFQFFTIPIGYLAGGWLVDNVFEPLMAAQPDGSWLRLLFGTGKGTGAAVLFLLLGFAGVIVCMTARHARAIWALEEDKA